MLEVFTMCLSSPHYIAGTNQRKPSHFLLNRTEHCPHLYPLPHGLPTHRRRQPPIKSCAFCPALPLPRVIGAGSSRPAHLRSQTSKVSSISSSLRQRQAIRDNGTKYRGSRRQLSPSVDPNNLQYVGHPKLQSNSDQVLGGGKSLRNSGLSPREGCLYHPVWRRKGQ